MASPLRLLKNLRDRYVAAEHEAGVPCSSFGGPFWCRPSSPRASLSRLKKKLLAILQTFATHEEEVEKQEAKNFLQSLQHVTDAEILRMLLFDDRHKKKPRLSWRDRVAR